MVGAALAPGGRSRRYTQIILIKPVSGTRLSPRERQILELLAHGCRATEVASELGLSPETVRTHVRNAMRKLEATTRVQAVAIAVENGAVSPSAPRSAA